MTGQEESTSFNNNYESDFAGFVPQKRRRQDQFREPETNKESNEPINEYEYEGDISPEDNMDLDDDPVEQFAAPENGISQHKYEKAKICNRCKKNTDKDSEYLQTEGYQAPIPIKPNNQDNITKIGTHTYALRNELKQLELDYQEIISQISISHEVSLSEKIKKMSGILYKNQHQLNQKPIYNPISFKEMLAAADKDLIASINNKYINGLKDDIG
uniref:Uncharacterized protein n=2 Tax=Rhizophagus irregularis TaxID=588596 RepID=U9T0H7_RHIID